MQLCLCNELDIQNILPLHKTFTFSFWESMLFDTNNSYSKVVAEICSNL